MLCFKLWGIFSKSEYFIWRFKSKSLVINDWNYPLRLREKKLLSYFKAKIWVFNLIQNYLDKYGPMAKYFPEHQIVKFTKHTQLAIRVEVLIREILFYNLNNYSQINIYYCWNVNWSPVKDTTFSWDSRKHKQHR